ncbi:MAG: histidine--tRNA ligase [Oscillospiraceae bacterium]|nr:histidine--tRNA ligase [Oscillospiraceae bacterium]
MAQKITGPRGTQDVSPYDSYKWLLLEKKLREIVDQYGFKEIRTPTFEHTELFLRGVGDTTDIVNKEMYTFEDKGKRSITLRPEGTASTVRSVLEKGILNEGLPLKAYYILSCFRYEKPQAGRLREFHQLGIELFGARDYTADAEVIATGAKVLHDLGLTAVKLNINSIGCPNCRPKYHEKLKEYFAQHIDGMCEDCKARYEKNPLRLLDCKEEKCSAIAKNAPVVIEHLCDECHDHFEGLKKTLDAMGVDYTINTKIVRGLDYYTKTVFEFVYDGIGSQGTVCGGGRYDGLFEELGGNHVPAVGFGMGLERLLMTLEAEGKSLGEDTVPDIFFAGIGEEAKIYAFTLAEKARYEGLRAQSDLMSRSLKAQMKFADKVGAKYTVVLGDEEIANKTAVAKNMATKEQVTLDLTKSIKEQLK